MVHIHHSLPETAVPEFAGYDFNKGFAVHSHQRLGHSIGQRLETRSQTGSKYHSLHSTSSPS